MIGDDFMELRSVKEEVKKEYPKMGQVKVSKKVKNLWPKSEGGTIHFYPVHGEDAYYLTSK